MVIEIELMLQTELLNWKFGRAKIELNVICSLPAGKLMKQNNPNDIHVWIQCRYERVSEFFHNCGILTHFTCQFQAIGASHISLNDGSQHPLYDFWLKAS